MLFEEDVTKYLEESKKKLLIDIYNILFIQLLFLFFLLYMQICYITRFVFISSFILSFSGVLNLFRKI